VTTARAYSLSLSRTFAGRLAGSIGQPIVPMFVIGGDISGGTTASRITAEPGSELSAWIRNRCIAVAIAPADSRGATSPTIPVALGPSTSADWILRWIALPLDPSAATSFGAWIEERVLMDADVRDILADSATTAWVQAHAPPPPSRPAIPTSTVSTSTGGIAHQPNWSGPTPGAVVSVLTGVDRSIFRPLQPIDSRFVPPSAGSDAS